MATENLLLMWVALARPRLEDAGFSCRVQDENRSSTCTAVALDNRRFIRTISHWPPSTFEFQFVASGSGDVVVLETKQFSSIEGLEAFATELLSGLNANGSAG